MFGWDKMGSRRRQHFRILDTSSIWVSPAYSEWQYCSKVSCEGRSHHCHITFHLGALRYQRRIAPGLQSFPSSSWLCRAQVPHLRTLCLLEMLGIQPEALRMPSRC